MSRPEIWSDSAISDLIEISQFTLRLWGAKVVARLENDVKSSIEAIKQFPLEAV